MPITLKDALASPVVGTLTGGIGSVASSLFSQSAQREENQKNRDFQREMWEKTNEWNSPANQRKLLEEGNYNPYLYGNDYQGSGASVPAAPATSPLPAMQNPLGGFAQLMQQGLQVESNVELQRMKSLEVLSDIMRNLYKDGGQKQLDDFMQKFAPMFESLNWSGSRQESIFNQWLQDELSSRYNQDMDSLNKELSYELSRQYSAQQIKANLSETDAKIRQIFNDINLSQIRTKADLKKIAAEIVVAGAQAWNLQKQGELYVADAKTADALRDGLVRQTKAIAGLRENEKYHSDIVKESNSYLYGYMTSDKGKRYKANYFQNATEWTGSDFGFAVDEIFGNYIKITGSASVGYNNSNVSSTSQSYNESHIFK